MTTVATRKEFTMKREPTMCWLNKQHQKRCKTAEQVQLCMC